MEKSGPAELVVSGAILKRLSSVRGGTCAQKVPKDGRKVFVGEIGVEIGWKMVE